MAALTESVRLELDGDVAVVVIDNPPVNALSHHVRQGILDGMTQAAADPAVAAIVLICDGRTFIAGADITEFGGPPKGPSLQAAQDAMENSPKPVVAAVHGTALGGGLEVAMCAHYRVADAKARFGLPEVKLGLLPGAGGTQRLPRVTGVPKALEMMTSGEPIGAEEALECGLVDEIVGDLRAGAVAFARRVVAEGRPLLQDPRPRRQGGRRRSPGVRRLPGLDRPQDPGLPGPRVQHPLHRGRGHQAVRGGPGGRAPAVRRADVGHPVEGPAVLLLRRAGGGQGARHAPRHPGAAGRTGSACWGPAPWAAASP